MDSRSLKLFQHLANSLHFGKTASAYHLSPSTLSRTIQRLEDELGSQLLIRDNRSVLLTSEGKKFLSYADQQISQFESLKQSLNSSQEELSGSLNIYCSVTASYSYLPPLLEKFRQAHPNIDINLDTGDAADGIDQIKNQRVDLAIAARPDDLASSIHFQTIATVPLAIVAPNINCSVKQAWQAEAIDWADLPIILPEHGVARKRFEQWFRQKYSGRPNVYAQVSGQEALVSMVALGCGIGLSPIVVVDNSPVKDRIQILSDTSIAPFDLGLCCFKKKLSDPIVAEFMAMANQA
ncbi:HTH-type transcriptional activator IlvY [SAR92 clade bacterium H231]|jgi:LysR family positive regulator for ilvC|nr:HTH-type transcriptional activator IlvY [Porticoccaceae bacterium]MCT2532529.1 HTH-type transcriptional activator IlvY [SAR92 clade bacterium H231]MBT6319673.1 HTH-type transcriptional activator IlvY [Porticoccaceae bacterium]MBT7257423.1 HTH-type transcriptional activator IlvY [Porticoccaceae bacterium]MDA8735465.1 HTH-type transcriptional activator IlvY [Porticoccaceae bacterium]